MCPVCEGFDPRCWLCVLSCPRWLDDLPVSKLEQRPKENTMHYRNGREAQNGDRVVQLSYDGAKLVSVGVLYDAKPGNDYCNGNIAPTTGGAVTGACMVDCLHADDLAAILAEKGLDKRPAGK